jgi:hypothetical protein
MSISSSATLALPRFHLRRNSFFAHGHAQPKLKLKLKRDGEGIGMGRATTSSGKAPPLRCSSPSYVTDTPKGEGEGEGFDLRRYWNSVRKEMEAELEKSVPLRYPEKIHVSMRYSVLAEKAKRGPPMMCIAACEAVGGSKQQALPTACALEMVHTASLIHDDLPCMDDDPIRRGQPSNHTVFGVDMAVLAGDALFPLGFEYIVSSTSDVPPDRIVKVIAQIAKTVGSQGMVAGQYMDLGSTGLSNCPKFFSYTLFQRVSVFISKNNISILKRFVGIWVKNQILIISYKIQVPFPTSHPIVVGVAIKLLCSVISSDQLILTSNIKFLMTFFLFVVACY